jgi:hypothetical protein
MVMSVSTADDSMNVRSDGPAKSFCRWAVCVAATIWLAYAMSVAQPADWPAVEVAQDWAASSGMQSLLPSECFHCVALGIWAILLAGAVARGYLWPLTKKQVFKVVPAALFFAIALEILQFLNVERVPMVFHAALNVTGVLAGLLIQSAAAFSALMSSALQPDQTRTPRTWRGILGSTLEWPLIVLFFASGVFVIFYLVCLIMGWWLLRDLRYPRPKPDPYLWP